METLSEARNHLEENFDQGTDCPCCGQFVKRYKRKLTSSMAYALILLYKHNNVGDVIHLENFFKSLDIPSSIRGDVSKLRYWGFIEKIEGNRKDGSNRNGFYRLTKAGENFIEKKVMVREYILLFNNRFSGFEGGVIDIHEALGNKFSYDDLMGSYEEEYTKENQESLFNFDLP